MFRMRVTRKASSYLALPNPQNRPLRWESEENAPCWLIEAGFSVTVDPFVRELDSRAVRRFGLMREENVYFCRKQGT